MTSHLTIGQLVEHIRQRIVVGGGTGHIREDELGRIVPRWRPMEEALSLVPPYKPKHYNQHWRCLLRLPDTTGTDYVALGWAYWIPPSSRFPDKPALLRWGCPTGQCWPKFWMPLPEASDA